MAATNIDKIFKQIEEDFVELSKEAARSAANKAQKDIRLKADKFIDEYYAEYTPKIYKRKYALYKLITKYYKERETTKGTKIEFGVEYRPSKIKGIHHSGSKLHKSGTKWISRHDSGFSWDSGDNGIPEPEWITERFLAGEHPWGDTFKSSDEKMQEFFDTELDNLVGGYMHEALYSAVEKYF